MSEDVIFANWCLSDNFGDRLTPYIIEKMSGKKAVWCPLESDTPKYLVVGSILNWDAKNCIAWGCGIANWEDTVPMKTVIATRGPLSAIVTRKSNISFNPSVYGDPALLLPRMYTPNKRAIQHKVGIIPHYADEEIVLQKIYRDSRIKVISPFLGIEEFIDEVNNCEKVFSSSLHGLIVADAYGVPSKWVEFSRDRIGGDKTKFIDYYMSLGIDPIMDPLELRENIDTGLLLGMALEKKEINLDLDLLWNSCPFKK